MAMGENSQKPGYGSTKLHFQRFQEICGKQRLHKTLRKEKKLKIKTAVFSCYEVLLDIITNRQKPSKSRGCEESACGSLENTETRASAELPGIL